MHMRNMRCLAGSDGAKCESVDEEGRTEAYHSHNTARRGSSQRQRGATFPFVLCGQMEGGTRKVGGKGMSKRHGAKGPVFAAPINKDNLYDEAGMCGKKFGITKNRKPSWAVTHLSSDKK
jgi:hypothetical protein